ncbi:MAG: UDP-3-O-(3-hydroxymyristoyl)glucosamine N-acyltransferase [Parvularculaceae bacterium]
MADKRFFDALGPLPIADAVKLSGATLAAGTPQGRLTQAGSLDADPSPELLIYCEKTKLLAARDGKAFGLCFAPPGAGAVSGGAVAETAHPKYAFALVAERLFQPRAASAKQTSFSAEGVSVDASAFVAEDAEIGAHVRIGPGAYVGPGVVIGEGSIVEAGAFVSHALIGRRAIIASGARIGQAGFGFAAGPSGLVRVPQLGRVLLGDGVEVGANTTIDRGALGDTVIGDGTKIDNLVQIGHNVRLGRNCIIAAQTGISGSCVIGDGVMMGGKVGLADHLTIGDGAMIAAGSGLMRDVPPGEKWGGAPARPIRDWLRETAALAKLAKRGNDE